MGLVRTNSFFLYRYGSTTSVYLHTKSILLVEYLLFVSIYIIFATAVLLIVILIFTSISITEKHISLLYLLLEKISASFCVFDFFIFFGLHLNVFTIHLSYLHLFSFLLVLPLFRDAFRELIPNGYFDVCVLLDQYDAVVKMFSQGGNSKSSVAINVLSLKI